MRWLLGPALLLASVASGEGGREVFDQKGCATCHSVEAEGITAKLKSGPDLGSAAGREAEWLDSYLTRKIRNGETQHPTAFQGGPGELERLILWIRALDDPPLEKPPLEKPPLDKPE